MIAIPKDCRLFCFWFLFFFFFFCFSVFESFLLKIDEYIIIFGYIKIQIWNLTCKNIESQTKNKSNTFSYYRKKQILSLQGNSLMFLQSITSSFMQTMIEVTTCSSRQDITMGILKQKPFRKIYAYSRTFWHFPADSGIIRHIEELFRHF